MAGKPDISVRVDGLAELLTALRKSDRAIAKDIGRAGKSAADIIAKEAAPHVPRRSGAAQASLRAVVAQGGGAVRGGSARVPYYPWLDFGGAVGRNKSTKRPYIRSGRYIYPALRDRRDDVVSSYEQFVGDVLRDAGLT